MNETLQAIGRTLHRHTIQRVKDFVRHGTFKARNSGWEGAARKFLALDPHCAACGSTARVQVHHKLPFHLHPELEMDPNNWIRLCEAKGGSECHFNIGHHRDWKSFNPNVVLDAAAALKKAVK